MTKPMYPGLGFATIPEELVPYTGEPLQEMDRIVNTNGVVLLYSKNFRGFSIFTNDPEVFLSEKDLYSQWTKRQ